MKVLTDHMFTIDPCIADFLGPFSNPSTNATSAIPAPISSLDSSQQNDQTSHLFQRKLDQEDLQDRMIALTFQREGARQRRPPHSRSNEKDVNIYTVRYDDNDGDEEEGQVGGVRRASNISEMGGGGVEKMNGITVEKWKKIKEVRTRASVLESLRRR